MTKPTSPAGLRATPRPGILDITPYVGGESEVPGQQRIIKLASNEGPFGPGPLAQEALRAAVSGVHRYPDGGCLTLRQALADCYGLDVQRLVCGAGSDELIALLCKAYVGPGDEVLYSEHGFLMYPLATKSCGGTPVSAPETDLTANVDALLAAVTDKTRILFIANPNNPTGSLLSRQEVARLHAGLPANVLLVIDAAYAEYCEGRNDYSPGDDLVEQAENVVMLRTFSKIHALGGLRIGWGYFPDHVADVLNRIRGPFNVSSLAQAAAVAALKDADFLRKSRAHNQAWLVWLTDQLRQLGLIVPDSVGNFVLARFPDTPGRTAADADAFLKSRGIIARRMSPYGLADSLRITIGLEDEMRAVRDALSDFLSS